jgi:hypothetical protein
MTSAPDRVQAFVARCLVDPSFLSTALDDPAGLDHATPRLFDESDLGRIALFQAFIVKVKHNGVRNILPLVFRMLPAVGQELAFYRSYAASYLAIRADGPLPVARQVQVMTEHLRRYLEQCTNPASAAVADLLTHELTIWRMHSGGPVPQPEPADGAIVWRGRMELKFYDTDLSRACAALMAKTFDPGQDLAEREQTLAYWRPEHGETVEFFEIDELTAMLFSMVDGRSTLEGIAEQLAGRGLDQIGLGDLKQFFGELAERDFIGFHAAAAKSALCEFVNGKRIDASHPRR